jgi:hypothetical protein
MKQHYALDDLSVFSRSIRDGDEVFLSKTASARYPGMSYNQVHRLLVKNRNKIETYRSEHTGRLYVSKTSLDWLRILQQLQGVA